LTTDVLAGVSKRVVKGRVFPAFLFFWTWLRIGPSQKGPRPSNRLIRIETSLNDRSNAMKILTFLMTATALTVSCLSATAQNRQAYLDDRSDGPALIRSLYNAISRKEYARAYSYFADRKPFGDYQSFVLGYAKTVDVQVITGAVTPEGAAGSIYTPVPVAIKSTEKGGNERIFSGCYITRIVNAANQEPPFAPLHIESAELEEVGGTLQKALPKVCYPPS
jgi:hypothetical protein